MATMTPTEICDSLVKSGVLVDMGHLGYSMNGYANESDSAEEFLTSWAGELSWYVWAKVKERWPDQWDLAFIPKDGDEPAHVNLEISGVIACAVEGTGPRAMIEACAMALNTD
ncbi:MAG: hypothetical protein AAF578_00250 [Pseudomonadota bacterium]